MPTNKKTASDTKNRKSQTKAKNLMTEKEIEEQTQRIMSRIIKRQETIKNLNEKVENLEKLKDSNTLEEDRNVEQELEELRVEIASEEVEVEKLEKEKEKISSSRELNKNPSVRFLSNLSEVYADKSLKDAAKNGEKDSEIEKEEGGDRLNKNISEKLQAAAEAMTELQNSHYNLEAKIQNVNVEKVAVENKLTSVREKKRAIKEDAKKAGGVLVKAQENATASKEAADSTNTKSTIGLVISIVTTVVSGVSQIPFFANLLAQYPIAQTLSKILGGVGLIGTVVTTALTQNSASVASAKTAGFTAKLDEAKKPLESYISG